MPPDQCITSICPVPRARCAWGNEAHVNRRCPKSMQIACTVFESLLGAQHRIRASSEIFERPVLSLNKYSEGEERQAKSWTGSHWLKRCCGCRYGHPTERPQQAPQRLSKQSSAPGRYMQCLRPRLSCRQRRLSGLHARQQPQQHSLPSVPRSNVCNAAGSEGAARQLPEQALAQIAATLRELSLRCQGPRW